MTSLLIWIDSRLETNALNTQIEITAATTRLWVTSSWYLRWDEMPRIYRQLMRQHQQKKQRQIEPVRSPSSKYKSGNCLWSVHVRSAVFKTRSAMNKGWTSKPTPRSDTARLSSSVCKVFGNDDTFLRACIVMMFNAMAVEDKKAFHTPVMTSAECIL